MFNIAHKSIIFLLLVFTTVCHAQTKPGEAADTGILKQGDIDATDYTGLPFWSADISHAGLAGYIDTFSVAGTNFRLIHNDSAFDGTLERYEKGNWIIQWIASHLGNNTNYNRLEDLNRDGYNDFVFYGKWLGELYLFNPQTKTFCDTLSGEISNEYYLLDTVKNIYYEILFGNLTRPTVSKLFTYKGMKRADLQVLTLDFDRNDDDRVITSSSLINSSGKKIALHVSLKQKISITDFDFKAFWKKHYK